MTKLPEHQSMPIESLTRLKRRQMLSLCSNGFGSIALIGLAASKSFGGKVENINFSGTAMVVWQLAVHKNLLDTFFGLLKISGYKSNKN